MNFVMPSKTYESRPAPLAIIMDGNGRWAAERGLPRSAGHRRGARTIEPLLECAGELGVRVLTLYAFSSDNWRRPAAEVTALMELFSGYLDRQARRCQERGLRLQVIGRRDRLPPALLESIARAERLTRRQRRLLVRVAIDYSSRWAIATAASRVDGADASGPAFRRVLARVIHSDPVCDPDLVIRTGGEQRLSDFLLWESAYSELSFSPSLFPDFGPDELRGVIGEFRRRKRRFGGLDAPPPAVASGASELAASDVAFDTGRAGAAAG